MEKIFNSGKGAIGGHTTGIGVNNVKRRLELFVGREDVFSVQSNVGTGTQITILLSSDIEGGNMLKILIVDDEAIERKGLSIILGKAFANELLIEEADTGHKAIEVAYGFIPDVIFMDMKMPGLDGIEAIQEIKKFNTNSKIIVVSAYDSFEYAQKSSGCWGL